ncbi:hypothetical protein CAEBREN_30637, partial [Caenorhabditis brenneri]
FRNAVTCRYYDCNRVEIHSARFKSRVWPLTVISCPRRIGVEYVSVSFDDDDEEDVQEPIPLIFRDYESIAESTKYTLEYLRLGWMFHLLQTHVCHHRSKFHSKWVVNMDIDERLVYTGPFNLKHYLRSMPSFIGEISFATNRVLKTEQVPERFSSYAQLFEDMFFLKHNKTTEISWYNLKGIIRPELVASLFYHWSYFQFEGVRVMSVPRRIGHVRYYRNMNKSALNGNWIENYNGTLSETRLAPSFEKKLVRAVKKRVKYVYDQRIVRCEEIPEWLTSRFRRELLDCKFRYE